MVSPVSEATAQPEEFRWVFIFIHAMKELYRSHGDWFDSMEKCKEDAEKYDFDYCCGFRIEYETRVKEPLSPQSASQ